MGILCVANVQRLGLHHARALPWTLAIALVALSVAVEIRGCQILYHKKNVNQEFIHALLETRSKPEPRNNPTPYFRITALRVSTKWPSKRIS